MHKSRSRGLARGSVRPIGSVLPIAMADRTARVLRVRPTIVAPPLAAIAGVVVILGALIAVETVRYADHQRGVRVT